MVLCAIYDKKAKNYETPFAMPNSVVATRQFMQLCQKPDTPLNDYPEDYNLQIIGIFDTESGAIQPVNQIVLEAANVASKKTTKED